MRAALEFVACDLGAESGRCMLGQFDGERVALSELSRFPNGPIQIGGSLHWDVLRLFGEIVGGLRRCARDGHRPAGIGLDTWGVDFALLDRAGNLLGNPYHYRDRRTQGMPDEAFRRVPREDIFAATGIQVMPINTLYQLLAQVIHRDPQLEQAQALLMMPDLLNSHAVRPHSQKFSRSGIIRSACACSSCGSRWITWDSSWYRVLIGMNWIPVAAKMSSRGTRRNASSGMPWVRRSR